MNKRHNQIKVEFGWKSYFRQKWESYFRQKCLKKCLKKARMDWVALHKHRATRLRAAMERSPNIRVGIEDSLAAGNCRPGTKRFLEEYNLPEEVSFGEILAHERAGEILSNHAFQRVVWLLLDGSRSAPVEGIVLEGPRRNVDPEVPPFPEELKITPGEC